MAARRVLCRCGHDRAAHQHYRSGTDCALCDCRRWSPRRWPWRRPVAGTSAPPDASGGGAAPA